MFVINTSICLTIDDSCITYQSIKTRNITPLRLCSLFVDVLVLDIYTGRSRTVHCLEISPSNCCHTQFPELFQLPAETTHYKLQRCSETYGTYYFCYQQSLAIASMRNAPQIDLYNVTMWYRYI